ncbi:MAG: hypothetical protein HZA68_05095 [Rhodovulum sp.]|nr:hypothetical protein [Rhodovulum sp.]
MPVIEPTDRPLPRHLERTLVLLLAGPVEFGGGCWHQEQADPDRAPILVIARNQTMAWLYAARLIAPLEPRRSLPRCGLTPRGRHLAAALAEHYAAHDAAFLAAQLAAGVAAAGGSTTGRTTEA